jgi:uncharacterized repeat protein (TIGR03803 family)
VFLTVAAVSSSAQAFKTLYEFTGGTDGSYPVGPLIQGLNGSFYGAAVGTTNGTIFSTTAQGKLTTQAILAGNSGPANLVLDNNGTYYGTELTGGVEFDGETFQLTPSGQFTIMYQFIGGTDGYWPSPLMQAADGNLYGTTYGGGNFGCNPPHGCGTVFRALSNGVITLYSFGTKDLGMYPAAALTQGPDGNLYGTTSAPLPGSSGAGTVFRITLSGKLTTLYQFCLQSGCPDGSTPNSTLVLGADGNFYGTTLYGGDNTCGSGGCGTIFKITPQGKLTTLYQFQGSWPLGVTPSALIQATDRNLYGTTQQGGDSKCGQGNGCGTFFRITPSGTFTLLHTFESSDGENPGAVVQGTNGLFYGATTLGGLNNCSNGCGTLFTLNVGAGQFVRTAPTAGKAATKVIVLGNNLTGTSSVSFNGTTAQFTVVSPTEITTTVPTGATTGKVTVTTPGGTLVSNVNFIVTH